MLKDKSIEIFIPPTRLEIIPVLFHLSLPTLFTIINLKQPDLDYERQLDVNGFQCKRIAKSFNKKPGR